MEKLVIGIGNELRADDGAGAFIVRQLEPYAIPHMQTEIVQQLTPEWLERMANAAFSILVDVRIPEPDDDGKVWLYRLTPSADRPSSGHALHIGELVSLGERLYGKPLEVYICSVPAFDFTLGHPFSEKGKALLEPAVSAILDFLKR
jgi:hydrogenase maturation protease